MIDTPEKRPVVQKPAPATSTDPAKPQAPQTRAEKRIERFPEH